ncbi:zinc finger CCCH domain-containing protein 3 isoform X1 [Gadus macrocephalus]|uniref:zinc finger CCCH domain-containing protein 3 isoform X1 n=1 Tax=Gadus macrocephalus TaxID=80720 RepID=UPI0028CB6E6F|nr:zinc finger CCCH domain-containing protein 3 isoform X1 [Gadus macrocephalus]
MTTRKDINMEEREALKRQIDILQNLINDHKRVHGNNPPAPVHSVDPAGMVANHGSGRGSSHVEGNPQSRANWRKKYSLNKKGQTSTGQGCSSSASSLSSSLCLMVGPDPSPRLKGANALLGVKCSTEKRDKNTTATSRIAKAEPLVHTAARASLDQGKNASGSSKVLSTVQKFQTKSCPATETSVNKRAAIMSVAAPSNFAPSSCSAQPGGPHPPPLTASTQPSRALAAQAAQAPVKRSKFTWVKTLDVGPEQSGPLPLSTVKHAVSVPSSVSNTGTPSRGPSTASVKRAPSKKQTPKPSLTAGAHRTSKYTWVSSSSSAPGQTRLIRKAVSPKALVLSKKAVVKGEGPRKSPGARTRKAAGASGPGAGTPTSRYRWKAAGRSPTGATGARRATVFQWTSEKCPRVVRGGVGSAPGFPSSQSTPSSSSSSSAEGFKLRSRMKIIRKSPGSGAGGVSERRTSPPAGVWSSRTPVRGRAPPATRSPLAARKGLPKELVSFGRHKLRRLSPGSHRKGHTPPSPSSPAYQRVFRSRYKMVARVGVANTQHYSPSLSWRAKRIQTARSLLQSRLRSPQDRHQTPQHWRGRDMRWIGGSLYRVSANKLSRTVAASMSINRTGKWSSPVQVCSPTPPGGRPSSTRHVASRAVQRSLAIIRNAHSKKQQPRNYCMYYNRFGKCNRGDSCPYIHDPDKVAVCTRFLRGTCKQAAGTCPFSHRVDKEKMPVCSYFLRGICNNSSCPYSHVYVSRTAAVCQDFIKGYCPQGEKCKKKHTLVCPDFSRSGSCPQGTRCKLQHRQRGKRRPAPSGPAPAGPAPTTAGAGSSATQPARRARCKEPTKSRLRLSVTTPPTTPGDLKLPSFISLSSSPEETELPDTADGPSPLQEKKLQIKPRL